MKTSARVHTPTIIQMEATECGATSLSIILGYYQRYITAQEARTACGVSRDGSRLINVLCAARNYGMDAYALNLDIDELETMTLPFMVYWEFNHFLVVEGFDSDRVYVNDPAYGARILTWDAFDKGFTGLAVEMTPGPAFKTGGRPPPGVFELMLSRIKGHGLALAYIAAATAILVLPKVSVPLLGKVFVDQVLINSQPELFKPIAVLLVFMSVTGMVLAFLQTRVLNRLKMQLDITNSMAFTWHLLRLPMQYFLQRAGGDIAERSLTSEKIADVLSKDIAQLGVGLLEMSLLLLVVAVMSLPLALVIAGFLAMNGLLLRFTRRQRNALSLIFAERQGMMESVQVNGLSMMESLRVGALEGYFFNRWIAGFTMLSRIRTRFAIMTQVVTLVPLLLAVILGAVVVCFGAFLVLKGQLTIGSVVAIQTLTVMLLATFGEWVKFLDNTWQLRGDLVRLNDLQDTPEDVRFSARRKTPPASASGVPMVEVRHLTFGYSPLEPPTVENVSLTLAEREHIAIVGLSGSGKSSLAKLICALFTPWSGDILINGVSLAVCSPQALSQWIGFMEQNPVFIRGTLRDNLTLWDRTCPDEKISALLQEVGMYTAVMERGGLSMAMTETGDIFSGGQKQCLELVRVLLAAPKLMVLDEATSAMDAVLEARILQTVWSRPCSTILITHRLESVRQCDRILVMHAGELVQQGTHEELMNTSALYRTLLAGEQW